MRFWRRFWDSAPRQLRTTTEGKIILVIAVAVGFAAINTGNNLLFIGWGMVLSGIIVSGILSEAALRAVWVDVGTPQLGRVREASKLILKMRNPSRRWPAIGIETEIDIASLQGTSEEKTQAAQGAFMLKLSAGERTEVFARYPPTRRGLHTVLRARIQTAFPFGFFHKTRRERKLSAGFWVAPARVSVEEFVPAILTRMGEDSAHRVGLGEDFFSLRPYRMGDDLRRVHWRRSARTGRWVSIETEAKASRSLRLWLAKLPDDDAWREYMIAMVGSLAERFLEMDFAVGLWGPGIDLGPDRGSRQRLNVLTALARLDVGAVIPSGGRDRVACIALHPSTSPAPSQADVTIPVGPGNVLETGES